MIRKGITRVATGTLALGGAFTAYELATDEKARVALSSAAKFDSQGLLRLGRTLGNVAITAADYRITLYNEDREKDYASYKEALRRVNLRSAKRLLEVCHKNGGLYTKFGQGIANMNHVIPPEFTDTLAPLQDRAREMSAEMAKAAVEAEIGAPVEEVFSEFDTKPIGAASLAQVHRGVLRKTGEEVAVKVQYPYLQEQTKGDLATLKLVTEFVGYWFPDFSYTWLTPEFEQNMELELNFVQEGRNAERLAKLFHHRSDICVPKINWDLTTKRMLVMEYIKSTKITDLASLEASKINPLEVAATVSSVFGDMIHVHGFVHCDPHPGNLGVISRDPSILESAYAKVSAFSYASILPLMTLTALFTTPGSAISLASATGAIVLTAVSGLSSLLSFEKEKDTAFAGKNGRPFQLVVYDHGMYRRLDPAFRSAYCLLWKSLLLRDVKSGRKAAVELGVPGDQYDVLSMIFTFRPSSAGGKTGQRMSKEDRKKIREQYKDVTMGEVNAFLQGLPRDLLFVLRSTNIVRSINLSLGGTTRLRFKIMGESAVRGVLVENPAQAAFNEAIVQHPEIPYYDAYQINIPVASELINTDSITWKQAFEMWRLRTYLFLIDQSWNLLARIVQLL